MKIKKIFSIIIITALCLGKINSQTSTPTNLSLPVTVTAPSPFPITFTFPQKVDYEALNSIQSTEVINNGITTTTYTAGNVIVLKPGFHAKAGSKFNAKIEDVSNRLTIMTINLQKKNYSKQARKILENNPDVVAVQEIQWPGNNFKKMKKITGYSGEYHTTDPLSMIYGIGILWKPSLGTPVIIKKLRLSSSQDSDPFRAYIIAMFPDYCVIATHYSQAEKDRKSMTEAILNESLVKAYQSSNKPVYIAGDMNEQPHDTSGGIQIFKDNGFEVLNNMERTEEDQYENPGVKRYKHATRWKGGMIDLILEYNTNPNHKTINQRRPVDETEDWDWNLSDHIPYIVKVKFK